MTNTLVDLVARLRAHNALARIDAMSAAWGDPDNTRHRDGDDVITTRVRDLVALYHEARAMLAELLGTVRGHEINEDQAIAVVKAASIAAGASALQSVSAPQPEAVEAATRIVAAVERRGISYGKDAEIVARALLAGKAATVEECAQVVFSAAYSHEHDEKVSSLLLAIASDIRSL